MSFDNYPVEMERARTAGRAAMPSRQPSPTSADRMNTITLTLKEQPAVPLEAEVLSPDVVAPLDHDALARPAGVPGQAAAAAWTTSSTVEGAGSDELEIRGDAGRVKWIGRGMTRGRITIVGNAGMHLGAYMKGGTIEVPATPRTGSAAR